MTSGTRSQPADWPIRLRLAAASTAVVPALEALLLIVAFQLLLTNAWTIASAPRLNSDSGTALAISLALANGDPGPLIHTLSPPLQSGTYAVLLTTGWTGAISAFPIVLSLALALLIAGLAYRATASVVAAAAALLLLFFSGVFWEEMGLLTFYPAFAILGYGGLYFAGRYLLEDSPRLTAGVLGGVLLALALYAFTTALLFLPVPALLLLCYWSRERFVKVVQLYAVTGVFALPWFAWHIAVGGTHFYHHPLNWSSNQMLPIVNREFWQFPHQSLFDYSKRMLDVGFEGIVIEPLWALVLVGLVFVWRNWGPRAVAFALLSTAFFLSTLAVTRPSPFLRYFYPIFPMVIVMASLGAFAVWQIIIRFHHMRFVVAFAAVIVAAAALASQTESKPVSTYKYKYAESLGLGSSYADRIRIAALIDDDRGVIARDSALQVLIPHNQTNTVYLISEEDYVTYLSWPSEEAVLEVLRKYDIGWIVLYRDRERWERDYNVWLERVYGLPPQHYLAVDSAQHIRKAYDGKIYILYEVLPEDVPQPLPEQAPVDEAPQP